MLTGEGIRHGKIWQLLTFQFLHAGLLHLVFNGIGLWGFGRFVRRMQYTGRRDHADDGGHRGAQRRPDQMHVLEQTMEPGGS